jgi:hypothetical protein
LGVVGYELRVTGWQLRAARLNGLAAYNPQLLTRNSQPVTS